MSEQTLTTADDKSTRPTRQELWRKAADEAYAAHGIDDESCSRYRRSRYRRYMKRYGYLVEDKKVAA